MNAASLTRLVIYALGILGGLGATYAASQGWATFDPATGALDIKPFNLNALIATIVATGGNLLAAIALWRGWGRK